MRALIIEDEYNSATALQNMLSEYCSDIECIGIFQNVTTGIAAIMQHKPDLIFLDIMLQNQNGFEILEALPKPHPQIIFTTAYDHFTIQAIRFSALDYLLKPINIKDLQAAVLRAQQNLKRYGTDALSDLFQAVTQQTENIKRIAIPTSEGHVFVDLSSIIRIEASGSYSKIILANEPEILVSRQLKEYELILEKSGFVRVHHSHLVNISHIKKYVRGNGGYLMMSDQKTVDVSQRKKEELLKTLGIH
jgi:two-component system LytT family response regulator